MSELLPCPFCGEKLGLRENGHSNNCYFTLIGLGVPKNHVHAAWNRRAPWPASMAPEVDCPVEPFI